VLTKPYPRPESRSAQIATVIGVGVFIALFLLLFKPFGLHEDYPNRFLTILGYGAITSIVLGVMSLLLPLAFPKWFEEGHWTVGKEMLMSSTTVFMIGLSNAMYTASVFGWPLSANLIINFQIITIIVGVIPMSFLVLLRYRQQSVVYDRGANALNNRITEQPNNRVTEQSNNRITEQPHSFDSSRLADQLSSHLADKLSSLLAIEAADNYVTEFWEGQRGVRQNLVRATMKMMEERPGLPPTMMRCHRSWLVNLDHVERVTGNAQGYRLHLPFGLEIPVARTRSAELERRLPHHSPLRPK
jgi:hypothetical protein